MSTSRVALCVLSLHGSLVTNLILFLYSSLGSGRDSNEGLSGFINTPSFASEEKEKAEDKPAAEEKDKTV